MFGRPQPPALSFAGLDARAHPHLAAATTALDAPPGPDLFERTLRGLVASQLDRR